MPTLTEKIELARDLGLDTQADIAQSKIKRNYIEELIGGEFCRKVTKKDLEDMFGVTHYNSCYFGRLSKTMKWIVPLLGIFALATSYLIIFLVFSYFNLPKSVVSSFLVIFPLIGIIVLPAILFGGHEDKASLEFQSIEKTKVDIPYGALLKIKDAKSKGLFDDIYCVQPTLRSSDPAIVGKLKHQEDSYYLLYAWDMDKDIENLK